MLCHHSKLLKDCASGALLLHVIYSFNSVSFVTDPAGRVDDDAAAATRKSLPPRPLSTHTIYYIFLTGIVTNTGLF